MIQKWAVATAVTAVTVMGALAAPASAISLAALESSGGTLETKNKIFSDFSCLISSDPETNTPTSCDQVEVSLLPNGLKFESDFFAAEGANSFIDVLIQYTVMAKPGTSPFNSIGLAFDGEITNPDGFTSITETVVDANNLTKLLGSLTVTAPDDLSDPGFELDQDVPLSESVTKAIVTKDIFLTDGARISMITQTYQVPEPGTIAGLVALGSLGIGSILKRQRRENS
ncbi:PEP-CTERM sorting domain-containing protein [Coleofasciculus sp.]|uniref:PEP-CTERM sorting domain-containing protein n=1 Tax=Coleofasciculus sp. TaxID=3100458 RepID=UPI0039F93ECB